MQKDLVLYDGECNMCRRMVAWCKRRDVHDRMDFVPSQMGPAHIMTPELVKSTEESVHVVTTDGRTLKAGRAVLHIFGKLGWTRFERFFSWGPILAIVEFFYGIVARNRIAFSKVLFLREAPYDYTPAIAQQKADASEEAPASKTQI